MTWNGFRGAAVRLEDIDLPRLGHGIGVGEDEIHALLDVEAAGVGFDRTGRPKMLFEPHVFHRNLFSAARETAVAQGLAYPKWKPGAYPADSYPRLAQALEIDETAALKAASWGLGQILGENHAAAGFASPQAMVRAFMDDEDAHLESMVRFLVTNGLDDDLREHRWEGLARGYNGPGYATHGYHTRLAAAYAKWSHIPDTPFIPPAGEGSIVIPRTRIGRGSRGSLVVIWQEILLAAGLSFDGGADGVFGGATETATKSWQRAHGLVADGVVGPKTWGAAG
ncbi:N-acetylmuramidase domain-containing protein [Hansschlegelia zhihuaiae]|uniref:DUF3380 domain-containing protein n=1 Tax=Hansschlegelia zhihuaiae TaxID=405005 RepID=A0A4V1KHM1_9HYPH|nr:N-acetylmuramidase domain-containing protein [Hansschlegelia zhihuaiae]RXF67672.1 DUF3380 domain-containing protein [Hansschlegelia zhihuaiae]